MKLTLPKFHAVKGYRTFLVSGLSVVFGVLALVDWNAFFSDWKAGVATIVMGLVMGFMRIVTDTPPGEAVHPDTKIVEKLPEIIEKLPESPKEAVKEEIEKDIKEIKK